VPECRLRPGPATVTLGHLAHDRETHSRPRIRVLAVQTLEHAEDSIVVLHVEANSAVGDGDDDRAALAARPDRDGLAVIPAELDGVGEEVGQCFAKALWLGRDLGHRKVARDGEAAGVDLRRQLLAQSVEERPEGDPPPLGRAALDAGVAEQVVDQETQPARRLLDPREVAPPRLVERIGVVLRQHPGESLESQVTAGALVSGGPASEPTTVATPGVGAARELTLRSARTRSRDRLRALQRGRVAALPRSDYWVGVLPGERDAPLGLCSSTAITSMDLARFRPSRTS
jgi:hypothetical protein